MNEPREKQEPLEGIVINSEPCARTENCQYGDIAIRYCAKVNGVAIGGFRVFFNGQDCKMDLISVRKEFRGMGVGTKLFQTFLEDCKVRGIKNLSGYIEPDNNVNLGLCRKIGFTIKPLTVGYSAEMILA